MLTTWISANIVVDYADTVSANIVVDYVDKIHVFFASNVAKSKKILLFIAILLYIDKSITIYIHRSKSIMVPVHRIK